jgi:hypothetical protein
MVYGMHGKVRSWPYVNQAFLWIKMAENMSCPATFGCSLRIEFQHLQMVYGKNGKFHVCLYVNQSLLWIN